jgi:hypothetical protein
MNVETRTLILRDIGERPDDSFSLDGYTRETPGSEPFTTLKRLPASAAADLETRAGVLRQERDGAVSEGRTLDAMLANFAAMLSIGDDSEAAAWIAAHHAQISASADAQRLMRSLSPNDAASAKLAVETLEEMKQTAGPHGYVLNIFQANTLVALHQGERAIQLFRAALAAEPTITGAWVDSETSIATATTRTALGPVGMQPNLSAPRTTCLNRSMIGNARSAATIRNSSRPPVPRRSI